MWPTTGRLRRSTPLSPDPPPRVVETHVSTLFFYGYRVFKFRRPVAYGFVDFTDPERRRVDCEREVELNRRLSPDVYLGTATLSVDAGADGRAVEHAVVMRRLPDERSLAELVRNGTAATDEVRRVAAALAVFHAGATRSAAISASATSTALWQRWQSTAEELRPFIGPLLDPDRYRTLSRSAARFLRGRGPLLEQRIAEGAICDGHGDLQAADVFCLDDGPRLLDCVEFDDELRYGDVLSDVAFLAADLQRLGAPEAAVTLLEEYRRRSGRDQPPGLVHFYIAFRAHIRLLVECLRAQQGCAEADTSPAQLLELALEHLHAAMPRLILVGGLPGSGKSTIAAWVATELGAELLSSDHLRRERAHACGTATDGGTGADGGAEADRYSEAARASVYHQLCDRAAAALGTGRSVVIDATWTSAARRTEARAVARRTSADLLELRCSCPAPERAARIADRLRTPAEESEATDAVGSALEAEQDPWPAAHRIDTSTSLDEVRQAVIDVVGSATDPWTAPAHALHGNAGRRMPSAVGTKAPIGEGRGRPS